jgi:hypothetical protein
MRFFLTGLMSMLREPARLFVLGVAVAACGGAERTFSGKGGAGGGAADGAAGSNAGAGGQKDASADAKGDASGSGGGMADARADVPDDAGIVEDTGPPPPPPTPGRPGMAILSGGTKMKSAKYQAVVAAGESPGSNGVTASQSYKLHGGVIGTTQPK